MSEHTFLIVPSNPWLVPKSSSRECVLEFLKSVSPTYEWDTNSVGEFPECHNWYERSVAHCPHCGAALDVHSEFDEWLEDSMGALQKDPSARLSMPCCRNHARYEQVRFEPEIGFASCTIGLHEPDYWECEDVWVETDLGPRLSEAATLRVEAMLGCKVVQLWRRQ